MAIGQELGGDKAGGSLMGAHLVLVRRSGHAQSNDYVTPLLLQQLFGCHGQILDAGHGVAEDLGRGFLFYGRDGSPGHVHPGKCGVGDADAFHGMKYDQKRY